MFDSFPLFTSFQNTELVPGIFEWWLIYFFSIMIIHRYKNIWYGLDRLVIYYSPGFSMTFVSTFFFPLARKCLWKLEILCTVALLWHLRGFHFKSPFFSNLMSHTFCMSLPRCRIVLFNFLGRFIDLQRLWFLPGFLEDYYSKKKELKKIIIIPSN